MSEALAPSSNIEWLENYYPQQTLDDWEVPFGEKVPFGGISDSISDSTSFHDDLFPGSDTILTSSAPRDSTGTTDGIPGFTRTENSSGANYDLSPKTTVAKQVRRRSRASRRKPTTLLNASIKNFRTLVQQYTGCQSASSAFRSGKGPITLSFGSSSSNQNDFPAPSSATAFGRGGNYYTDQLAQFQEKQQHYNQLYLDQILHQGKQSENSNKLSALSHSGSPMLTVENCGWQ